MKRKLKSIVVTMLASAMLLQTTGVAAEEIPIAPELVEVMPEERIQIEPEVVGKSTEVVLMDLDKGAYCGIHNIDLAPDGVVDNMTDIIYTSYDKICSRWGKGTIDTYMDIYIITDEEFLGSSNAIAYAYEGDIYIRAKHLETPNVKNDYIVHEMAHILQGTGEEEEGFQSEWWIENLANYAQFRYCNWINPKTARYYADTKPELKDWGFEPYGKSDWFFSWMDERYPTTQDEDGRITYGLIDSIHFAIHILFFLKLSP